MVNKKIVIIVTIIAIIVVSGIVYFSLVRDMQNQYTYSEQTVENQVKNDMESDAIIKQNSVKEDKIEEENKEENKTEKEDKEEIEENQVSEDTSKDKEKEENHKLAKKDKAIELAKKEWGENDNTVYYHVEEQVSDNVYIISVRDQSTTQDLLTYKVNVSSGSVEEN